MALTDDSEKPPTETHQKPHERHQDKREKPLTKVIVRRLPPTITLETFLNQVSPIPDYDYIYTVAGDSSLGENSFARAYINFTHPEDIFTFKERFDGYVFVDARGHEYPAVVEFAAFQRIPKKRNRQKNDPKCGTIETDVAYLEFVEQLKSKPEQEEKPEFTLQLSASDAKTEVTTPLLEYVKQRRQERQRMKEERREERKRREFERKKMRDEDQRKRFEDKSPVKTVVIKPNVSKQKEAEEEGKLKESEQSEKPAEKTVYSGGFKNKEKKYDERKTYPPKSKYPIKTEKKDYYEKKMDYKARRDDAKSSYKEDYSTKKDDTKVKKIKKYSERREERKNVAKLNEKKPEPQEQTPETPLAEEKKPEPISEKSKPEDPEEYKTKEDDKEAHSNKSKEGDPRVQRRIRNKDRPTMQIYQPGMLSKRRQTEGGDGSGDAKPGASEVK